MKIGNRTRSSGWLVARVGSQPTAHVSSHSSLATRDAFTLIEVMFAVVAFCVAMFATLALVSNSLADARRLQRPMLDAGVVASWLSQTNQLVEGENYHVNLGDLLGDAYDKYDCTYDIQEVQTNKLFQVNFVIKNDQSTPGENPIVSKMSIVLFRPASPAGSLDEGIPAP
jgi:prepilin-type N-terminal cleavage/methylation domain-containing protein